MLHVKCDKSYEKLTTMKQNAPWQCFHAQEQESIVNIWNMIHQRHAQAQYPLIRVLSSNRAKLCCTLRGLGQCRQIDVWKGKSIWSRSDGVVSSCSAVRPARPVSHRLCRARPWPGSFISERHTYTAYKVRDFLENGFNHQWCECKTSNLSIQSAWFDHL